METKPLAVLVMSVGHRNKNGTVKQLVNMGAPKARIIVVLPKQYEKFAKTYTDTKVFIYDEKKYINEDFEFFGFKPRNCGGIGRQGIAEAVDKLNKKYLLLQVDDDTASFYVRIKNGKSYINKTIKNFEILEKIYQALDKFYKKTGIYLMARTGATNPGKNKIFGGRKVFNNFLMYKEDVFKYDGFKQFVSDDYNYNNVKNLLDKTPTLTLASLSINFTETQGNRDDGNAILYNGDLSWKKAYALKLKWPWCCHLHFHKEGDNYLFREHIQASKVYPNIIADNGIEITKAKGEKALKCIRTKRI